MTPSADEPNDPTVLPSGSVVPGADIWDDDDGWEPTPVATTWREVTGEDESWLVEAQVVVHDGDVEPLPEGPHDGSDGVAIDDDDDREAFGTRLTRWSRTSVVGASLAGMGIGLQKVLNPRDPIQIEIEADSDDDALPEPVEVKLDHDRPDQSVAVLRPWLQEGGQSSHPSASS